MVLTPCRFAAASQDDSQGKAVYEKACKFCHSTGALGSPKLGDEKAWKARIDKGMETLFEHSIQGYEGKVGKMPARGGNPNLTDQEVKAAVRYMVDESE